MAALLRIVRLVTLALVAAVTAVFAYLFYIANPELLALRFLDWSTPELPLWAWLLAAMLLGYLLGLMSMAGLNLKLRWRLRRAERGRAAARPQASDSNEARELPNPAPG